MPSQTRKCRVRGRERYEIVILIMELVRQRCSLSIQYRDWIQEIEMMQAIAIWVNEWVRERQNVIKVYNFQFSSTCTRSALYLWNFSLTAKQTQSNTQVKVLIPFPIVFLPQHNAHLGYIW